MTAGSSVLRPGPTLITGARGFVGRALLQRLRAQGVEVLTPLPVDSAISGVEGASRYGNLLNALKGIDCVVHTAARVHVLADRDPDPLRAFRASNVDLTLSLARQAASSGVRRFVFLSSVKVHGSGSEPGKPFTHATPYRPEDAYALSKMEAEIGLRGVCARSGMELVLIRPPLVYGPGVKANFDTLIRLVCLGLPLPLGGFTKNRRSLVGLDNLVDFIALCMVHPDSAGEAFMVSDGEDISTAELVLRLAHAMGKPARLFRMPPRLIAAARMAGLKEFITRLEGSLQVDVTQARARLQWKPMLTLEEGLSRVLL